MKAYSAGMLFLGMVLAAVTMVAPAYAGQTQAEREWTIKENIDPESVLGWQVRPPVATGSLPADEVRHMKSGSGATSQFPTVEIGGTVYRIGIDTY
jgi:hypothetical protein